MTKTSGHPTGLEKIGHETTRQPYAVVVGGANIDVKAQSLAQLIPATSNPGRTATSAGGVGRNIAENISRLGTRVHLIASIGNDLLGDRLIAETVAAGVETDFVTRSISPTGTYTAVLDVDGELVAAIADMSATDELDVALVESIAGLLAAASMVVLDANVGADVAARVAGLAAEAGVPLLLDPVSDPKALRIAPILQSSIPLFMITPNRTELAALTGVSTDSDSEISAAAAALLARGVENVWVRLGERGSQLFRLGCEPIEFAAHPAVVHDVTGAGDAMAGAFVHAWVNGRPIEDAIRFAHAAAALTIASAHTVRPDLTVELVEAELRRM